MAPMMHCSVLPRSLRNGKADDRRITCKRAMAFDIEMTLSFTRTSIVLWQAMQRLRRRCALWQIGPR